MTIASNPLAHCLVLILLGAPTASFAQRANENTTLLASDAFGAAIGNERIGLYSNFDVRGFSPITAGNIRLEGIYIDRPAEFSERLVSSEAIHVGISAQNYLFTAPTGVDDFRFRPAGNKPLLSAYGSYAQTGNRRIDLDGQLPVDDRLSIAGGAGIYRRIFTSRATGTFVSYALRARWQVASGVEISPFWSRVDNYDRQASPTLVTASPFIPDRPRIRDYVGPDWTEQRNIATNYGALAKVSLGDQGKLALGIFRSVNDTPHNYSLLLRNLTPAGMADRRVVIDPPLLTAATSGELRVERSFLEGDRKHILTASLRGRRRFALYGGGMVADFGRFGVDETIDVEEPQPAFGARTRERVRQVMPGMGYELRWRKLGSLMLGLQRSDYRKRAYVGAQSPSITRDRTWLYNANLALELSEHVALYSSVSSGLEESGVAPENAANRGQVLPAIHTRQADGGVRLVLPANLRLVAGLFDIRKPYFGADENGFYAEMGVIRSRGAEISLTGSPLPGLNLVSGAVLLQPRVKGPLVDQGRIGKRPLNSTAQVITFSANYEPPSLPGLILSGNLAYHGRRAANTTNQSWVPAAAILDLSIRHRLKINGYPAMLRLQANNVTDRLDWQVLGNNGLGFNSLRTISLSLTADIS